MHCCMEYCFDIWTMSFEETYPENVILTVSLPVYNTYCIYYWSIVLTVSITAL